MTEAAVSIHDLTVVRGKHTVLEGLNLEITHGVVTGLLGPSGCGKTTLMRAIVGVQRVRGGSVTVLERPAGSPSLRTRVAYVTQAPSVYLDITVAENLRYFARVLGVANERIDRAIATVGLGGHEDALGRELSGGQLNRLSLATALLGEPELLVLDEPTVGLDPVLRQELWGTFHELCAAGATLLVSSHVMDEADRCDRLILMRDGAIIAHETPADLRVQTGKRDLEEAFLALVRGAEAVA